MLLTYSSAKAEYYTFVLQDVKGAELSQKFVGYSVFKSLIRLSKGNY